MADPIEEEIILPIADQHPNHFISTQPLPIVELGGYDPARKQTDGLDPAERLKHHEVLRRIDEVFLKHPEARSQQVNITVQDIPDVADPENGPLGGG